MQHPHHAPDGAHCVSELLADDLAERKPEGLMLTALLAFLALLATLVLLVCAPFLPELGA